MSRPRVKKRSGKKLDEAALIRRLAGALPLWSPRGVARIAAWLDEINATVAGKTVAAQTGERPAFSTLLSGIAESAPYLWDLVRAAPARLLTLLQCDPGSHFEAIIAAPRSGRPCPVASVSGSAAGRGA